GDHRGPAVAGDRLGRGTRYRGAVRAVPADGAERALPRTRGDPARARGRLPLLLYARGVGGGPRAGDRGAPPVPVWRPLPGPLGGSEDLSNTPRQFLMYEAFGWAPPRVAHLPVLLGVDRKKLSKRHGDTSVRDYARLGYLPEALVNFFALMGWYPEDGRELFTVPDLIERFRIEEMGKSAAVFDILKLNWMNVEYMQAAYRENPDRVI